MARSPINARATMLVVRVCVKASFKLVISVGFIEPEFARSSSVAKAMRITRYRTSCEIKHGSLSSVRAKARIALMSSNTASFLPSRIARAALH